jgi:hypothetical protein
MYANSINTTHENQQAPTTLPGQQAKNSQPAQAANATNTNNTTNRTSNNNIQAANQQQAPSLIQKLAAERQQQNQQLQHLKNMQGLNQTTQSSTAQNALTQKQLEQQKAAEALKQQAQNLAKQALNPTADPKLLGAVPVGGSKPNANAQKLNRANSLISKLKKSSMEAPPLSKPGMRKSGQLADGKPVNRKQSDWTADVAAGSIKRRSRTIKKRTQEEIQQDFDELKKISE